VLSTGSYALRDKYRQEREVEAAGIEPASEIDVTSSAASGCEKQETPSAANALHCSDSKCLDLASIDADLREVLLAWSALPKSVRQVIVLLAKSSRST
jgi:hypothetical protein